MSGLAQPALQRLTWFAAGLSAFASVLHGSVTPEHVHDGWGYAAVFVVASVAQMLFAVVLLTAPWNERAERELPDDRDVRNARALYLVGAAGTAAIVALYVTTRTAGIHHAGHETGVLLDGGTIDVVTKAAGLALIGVLLRLYQVAAR